MSNPFEDADRWEVSTENILTKGNYLCEIAEAEGDTSSGNYPQITLKLVAEQGYITDWLVYHEKLLGKVSSLYEAAGVQVPQEGEFNVADHCRLTEACIARVVGKKVGVVVRPEPDRQNPGQFRDRVKGYVPAAQIADGGGPVADDRGLPEPGQQAKADSKIPF